MNVRLQAFEVCWIFFLSWLKCWIFSAALVTADAQADSEGGLPIGLLSIYGV